MADDPDRAPTPRMRSGRLMISWRRLRAPSSRARRRAFPTWHCADRAAYLAIGSGMPSRRVSNSATAATGGVRRRTWRQRERINLNVPPLLALEAMAVSLQVQTPSTR